MIEETKMTRQRIKITLANCVAGSLAFHHAFSPRHIISWSPGFQSLCLSRMTYQRPMTQQMPAHINNHISQIFIVCPFASLVAVPRVDEEPYGKQHQGSHAHS
jgi:hypothetical protein